MSSGLISDIFSNQNHCDLKVFFLTQDINHKSLKFYIQMDKNHLLCEIIIFCISGPKLQTLKNITGSVCVFIMMNNMYLLYKKIFLTSSNTWNEWKWELALSVCLFKKNNRDFKCYLSAKLLSRLGIKDFPPGPGRMLGNPRKCGSLFSKTGEMIFFFLNADIVELFFLNFDHSCVICLQLFFPSVSSERELPNVRVLLSE